MSSTRVPDLLWRKSSYTNGQANCVEIASMKDRHTIVAVRDSKALGSHELAFTASLAAVHRHRETPHQGLT